MKRLDLCIIYNTVDTFIWYQHSHQKTVEFVHMYVTGNRNVFHVSVWSGQQLCNVLGLKAQLVGLVFSHYDLHIYDLDFIMQL